MGDSSPSTGRGGHGGTELLLQWIDHYEEAVTNHYSPELRARVSAVRPNGLYGDSFPPPSNTPAFRVASKAGGFKVGYYFIFPLLFFILFFFVFMILLDAGYIGSRRVWNADYWVPWKVHAV